MFLCSVPHGLPRQRLDGGRSLQLALPVTEPETMENNDGLAPDICVTLHCHAGLSSAQLLPAPVPPLWTALPLPPSSAWLLLVWPLLAQLGLGLPLPLCSLQTLPAWEGDGQWQQRTASTGLVPTTFLMERGRQNHPLPGVRLHCLLPNTTAPRDEVHGIE